VVGVLPDDDDLHAVEGAMCEGVEDFRPAGVDRCVAVLLSHEVGQSHEVVLLKFAG